VEFRHRSWHCEATFALLAEHRTAYRVMSGANLPCVLRATTGQDVYVYFNNDSNANAVRNARTLQALLAPDSMSYPVTHSDVFGRRALLHVLDGDLYDYREFGNEL